MKRLILVFAVLMLMVSAGCAGVEDKYAQGYEDGYSQGKSDGYTEASSMDATWAFEAGYESAKKKYSQQKEHWLIEMAIYTATGAIYSGDEAIEELSLLLAEYSQKWVDKLKN